MIYSTIIAVSFHGIKVLPFALLIEKKKHQVLAVPKSSDTAKYVSTDGQFFRKQKTKYSYFCETQCYYHVCVLY